MLLIKSGSIAALVDANAATNSFKTKKITGQTGNHDRKKAETKVPMKCLSNFWRTLEMPLINCEINLDLNWSGNCVIQATNVAAQATTFSITYTKLNVSVVTLSTQHNAKLLKQLKCGFKRTINCNKYQSKISTERQNQYLYYLIDPSFALTFENEAQRISYK